MPDASSVNPLLGVVVGGGLTLIGTGFVELLKARAGSTARRDARNLRSQESQRAVLERVRAVSHAYRSSLQEYEIHLRATTTALPAPDVQKRFQDSRSEFQAAVPRVVVVEARQALLDWEQAALEWSQGVGSGGEEDRLWAAAMTRCGEAEVASFDEPQRWRRRKKK